MTAPTPDAFDPTAPLRDIYRQAEQRLLAALVAAVRDGLADDATDVSRFLAEQKLRQDTRSVVDALNRTVPGVVDQILQDAAQEGRNRAAADDQ